MSVPVTGLSIGLLIYDILAKNATLATLGVKNILPCYNRNAEGNYPFVLFNTGSALNIPVKSNSGMDEMTFTIESCAKTYEVCVRISEAVRIAIEGNREVKNLSIDSVGSLYANQFVLRDVDEFYDLDLDCYVQKLQFSCKAWGDRKTTKNSII